MKKILLITTNTKQLGLMLSDLRKISNNSDITIVDQENVALVNDELFDNVIIDLDIIKLLSKNIYEIVQNRRINLMPTHLIRQRKFDTKYQLYRIDYSKPVADYTELGLGINVTNKLIKYFKDELT